MPNVKDWRKDILSMSNGELDTLAGIVRLELRHRVNALHEMYKLPEKNIFPEKKEWLDEEILNHPELEGRN